MDSGRVEVPPGASVASDATMKGPRGQTIVLKLGTSSIVDEESRQPHLPILSVVVETAVKLRDEGHRVIIVSSGAIGVGMRHVNLDKRPKRLAALQALAATGQCQLMALWDSLFSYLRQPIAQILLTRNDISDRTMYLNAQNTFNELLDMGIIPIVNENDTIAVSEIKFGDNDTLSAITAAMVHADILFLMTDVDCLYDKNPRTNPDAQAIEVIDDIDALEADVSTAGSALGTGGMSTKVSAARLASSAGVTTVITRANSPKHVKRIVNYIRASRGSPVIKPTRPANGSHSSEESLTDLTRSSSSLSLLEDKPPLHTRFLPDPQPIRDRHFWLLHGLAPHGTLYIDIGAYEALVDKAGLLPAGVVDVEGMFAQHEAVRLVTVDRRTTANAEGKFFDGPGVEVGRAIVNYAASEINRIKGHKSSDIEELLGFSDSEYVISRQHSSFYKRESRPPTPSMEHNQGAAPAMTIMDSIAALTTTPR